MLTPKHFEELSSQLEGEGAFPPSLSPMTITQIPGVAPGRKFLVTDEALTVSHVPPSDSLVADLPD